MRLPPTKLEDLRERLRKAGLYNERNEPLIKVAVMQECLVEQARAEFEHQNINLTHKNTAGFMVPKRNPAADFYKEALNNLARTLAYLGLGNKTEMPSEKENKKALALLDELMS